MENRDRDKMSKSTGSTPAGDVNRNTSSNIGQQKSGGSEFGQKSGRSENIGGESGRTSGSSGVGGDLGRTSGNSGMKGDVGRSKGSSSADDIDRGDLDKKSTPHGSGSSSGSERL